MADYEFIRYEQRDHVATVTLNRPELLNAIHPPMAEELADAWERVRDDDSVWVGVLTGSGARAVCAGADLKWRADAGEAARSHNRAEASGAARGFQRGRDCYKPLLAVVNGYAVGGGLELVLGCDLVVAAEHAQLGLPEARRGLLADAGGIHKLVRRLPWSAAMQLILTGELISAEEARRIGLVNQVVPAEGLQAAAEQWVEAILACAPLSLQAGKEAAVRGLELPLWEAVNTRFPLAERMYESEDFIEGPKAFAEKRKPVWKGK
ncbi:MAG: enoyl-CoA hydratase-related protein [Gemmatimonadetes bacterium]|nr:enoyl-CoA hydratase-related protein [Gemmatimonadota bacterium]